MDDEFGSDADFLALATAVEQQSSVARPATQSSNAPPANPLPQKKVTQPTPQALHQRSGPSAILVSPRQKGNPLLAHIQALPWEYTDTPADYVLGTTACALFLSLKYHRLHPEYIYARIRALGKRYNLRVLLALIDIDNHEQPLRELAKTSLVNDLTLLLAWSAREGARYLEAYKALERAGPTAIRGAPAASYAERLVEFATVPRGVNRTDAVALVSQFGSLRGAINARPEEVAVLQGWGDVKVRRWCEAVREPFRVARAAKRSDDRGSGEAAVPLGRAPNRPHRTEPASTGGRAEAMSHEQEMDTGQDAEEAALAAAANERENAPVDKKRPDLNDEEEETAPPKRARAQTQELSEGVQAALAKYRSP